MADSCGLRAGNTQSHADTVQSRQPRDSHCDPAATPPPCTQNRTGGMASYRLKNYAHLDTIRPEVLILWPCRHHGAPVQRTERLIQHLGRQPPSSTHVAQCLAPQDCTQHLISTRAGSAQARKRQRVCCIGRETAVAAKPGTSVHATTPGSVAPVPAAAAGRDTSPAGHQ